jgi:hypothetical protein
VSGEIIQAAQRQTGFAQVCRAAELEQVDDRATLDDRDAQTIKQPPAHRHRAADGDQVVDQDHAIALLS